MAAAAPGPSRTAPPLPTSVRSASPQARTHTQPCGNRLRAAPPSPSDPHPQSSLGSAPLRTAPHSPSQNGGRVLRRLTPSPSSPLRGAARPQPMGARRSRAQPMGAKPRLLPGGPGTERPRRAGGRGRHLNPLTEGSAGAAAALCPARAGPSAGHRPRASWPLATAPRPRCQPRPARELAQQTSRGPPAPAAAGGFKEVK